MGVVKSVGSLSATSFEAVTVKLTLQFSVTLLSNTKSQDNAVMLSAILLELRYTV